ncbi:MAG: hypothetical protein ACJARD_001374 [Alphaproteobacteria bacterium]|jgi:hypothetical protein
MKYYHLFWDAENKKPYIVKSGFNFFAFFFGSLYFVYYRAWFSAGAFFAASFLLVILQIMFKIPEFLSIIMNLVFHIYIGYDAADCLFGEYHKKGFQHLGSDFYTSQEHAIAAVFEKNP